jgi:hypothetical protein
MGESLLPIGPQNPTVAAYRMGRLLSRFAFHAEQALMGLPGAVSHADEVVSAIDGILRLARWLLPPEKQREARNALEQLFVGFTDWDCNPDYESTPADTLWSLTCEVEGDLDCGPYEFLARFVKNVGKTVDEVYARLRELGLGGRLVQALELGEVLEWGIRPKDISQRCLVRRVAPDEEPWIDPDKFSLMRERRYRLVSWEPGLVPPPPNWGERLGGLADALGIPEVIPEDLRRVSWEPDPFVKYLGLRLLPNLGDLGELSEEDRDRAVVARVAGELHLRVFDRDRKLVASASRKTLPERARQFACLEDLIVPLWPPHEPTYSEAEPVVAAVTALVGYPSDYLVRVEKLDAKIVVTLSRTFEGEKPCPGPTIGGASDQSTSLGKSPNLNPPQIGDGEEPEEVELPDRNKGPVQPAYLGLLFDDNSKTIRREGPDSVADFSSDIFGFELVRLFARYPDRVFQREDLFRFWAKHGVESRPQDNTIFDRISDVNKILSSINVRIRKQRKGGWTLAARN